MRAASLVQSSPRNIASRTKIANPHTEVTYADAVSRANAAFFGEHPSVISLGAYGDLIQISDASISGGSNVLNSASSHFTAANIGQNVGVAGAGTAGVYLTGTITGVNSATQVTLSATAAVGVTGADAYYGHDDSLAFQHAWNDIAATGGIIEIPFGNYLIETGLDFRDILAGVKLQGLGPGCVIFHGASLAGKLMDVSGSMGLEFANFTVDGSYRAYNSSVRGIYGDGSTAHSIYGDLKFYSVLFRKYASTCMEFTASSGKTLADLDIDDCRFHDCGLTGGADIIHIGGVGTKKDITINKPRMIGSTNPSTTGGAAIFIGNGTVSGARIQGHLINNAASTGIKLYCRPAGAEIGTPTLRRVTVGDGTIHNQRWSAIQLWGGNGVKVADQDIYNPGTASDASAYNRCGIFLAGAFANPNIEFTLTNATLTDCRIEGTLTMAYGVYSDQAGAGGGEIHLGPMDITGATLQDVAQINSPLRWTALQMKNGNIGIGFNRSNASKPLDVDGDIRARRSDPSAVLFNDLIQDSIDVCNLVGLGTNLGFNRASGAFESGSGSTGNAFSAKLMNIVSGVVSHYRRESTSTGSISYDPVLDLPTYLTHQIDELNRFISSQYFVASTNPADMAVDGVSPLDVKAKYGSTEIRLGIDSGGGEDVDSGLITKPTPDELIIYGASTGPDPEDRHIRTVGNIWMEGDVTIPNSSAPRYVAIWGNPDPLYPLRVYNATTGKPVHIDEDMEVVRDLSVGGDFTVGGSFNPTDISLTGDLTVAGVTTLSALTANSVLFIDGSKRIYTPTATTTRGLLSTVSRYAPAALTDSVSGVTGTPGSTYGATEQTILTNLISFSSAVQTAINNIVGKINDHSTHFNA